ncbi:MAG: cytochrome c oxidase subunit 3 [Acidobacteria bacterium]|nr:cytochrome c oxidase subunit 3 [Acidobacteriota bacterium]MDW7983857.1 cytochrome c oxidase subunit 3 [Acidobacteriota bacterium]
MFGKIRPQGSGPGIADSWHGGDDGENPLGPGAEGGALPVHTKQIGLWALLVTISMLFAGFTSAYLARRAAGEWTPIPLPRVLWLNTLILLASSATMEVARRTLRSWNLRALKRWLGITMVLGLAFLRGQFVAWKSLEQQGIFLPTNPHGSFFYLLTAVHGLHVLGGLIALGVVWFRAWRERYTPYHPAIGLCATYWHFMDLLWVYLFVLLFIL